MRELASTAHLFTGLWEPATQKREKDVKENCHGRKRGKEGDFGGARIDEA